MTHGTPAGTRVRLIEASKIKPTKTQWLWPGRIPAGAITVLTGRPGLGKSFLAADIAARVTRGTAFPDGAAGGSAGGVLILDGENDPGSVLVPRLLTTGADLNRVSIIDGAEQDGTNGATTERSVSLADPDLLRQAFDRMPNLRLLIVDPLGSFLGRGTDANTDTEIRSVLGPVATLARETRVAVLLIAHTRKAAADSADAGVLGSTGIVGIARAVWHVQPHSGGDRENRLFLPGKSNLGRRAQGWAFRVVDEESGRVEWIGPTAEEADDLEAARQTRRRVAPKVEEAARWLEAQLADGPRPAAELAEVARGSGFTKSTLERARAGLGVKATKADLHSGWILSLPTEGPHLSSGE